MEKFYETALALIFRGVEAWTKSGVQGTGKMGIMSTAQRQCGGASSRTDRLMDLCTLGTGRGTSKTVPRSDRQDAANTVPTRKGFVEKMGLGCRVKR